MINFHISIRNPWYTENFDNLYNRSGRVTENKTWEFEVIRYSYTLAEVSVNWSFRSDHAGIELVLGLFGYAVSFAIRDNRHWDRESNTWTPYESG